MDNFDAGRTLMSDSLGFHIIFVSFGLGLPIVMSVLEFFGVTKNNPKLLAQAKFWSKIASLLVVTGVISGTLIAAQMTLLWPGILEFGGDLLGLPFMLESNAFLIEAVFLSIYMATWGKISGIKHWLLSLPIILASATSAFFITAVNAWMHRPTGFVLENGAMTQVDVWQGIFTNTTFIKFGHSMLAYYTAVCLTVAGYYMVKAYRTKTNTKLNKMLLTKFMIGGLVLLGLTGIMGDVSAKYLAKHEPLKLAALEGHFDTKSNADLLIGGLPKEDGEISGPHIRIPNGLSILAGNSPETEVKGLRDYERETWPALYIHMIFDMKMAIVALTGLIIAAFFVTKRWLTRFHESKLTKFGILLSGPLAFVLIELGWIMSEIGRQPYAVVGFVKTADAFNNDPLASKLGYAFPVLFVLLSIVTILGLRQISTKNKESL